MGFEQPRYVTEDEEKKTPVNEVPASEVPASEVAAAGPERSNVIEGPWRREAPDRTPTESAEAARTAVVERNAAIEKKRGDIEKIYAEEERRKEKEDSDEKDHPFTETFTRFRRCDACGGKGRRWMVFACPVCKGRGSVPASVSQREGVLRSK